MVKGMNLLVEKTKKRLVNDMELAPFFFANKIDMAEKFHAKQPFFYDKNCLWWLWNKEAKQYMIIDETDLISVVDTQLGRSVPLLREKNKILESLKIVGRNNIPKDLPKHWIQFKNCFYDIKSDSWFDCTSEYFCVNPIPWNLGEKGDTPMLDKLFAEWVTTPEEVQLLYEIIAYCLYPDYPLARIFCIYGKGSNGKSVFMNIVSKLLGYDNCCSTSLESLTDNRFESAKLYKKMMCRLSEIHNRTLSKTSLLKNISGGDPVSVEFKNKNPFDAIIYSKIIIGTNTIPISMDDTDGFFRRWIVIDFPNQFTEEKNILESIPDSEFENLTFKALAYLKNILVNRKFAFEGSIEERKKRYNERANPIESFIESCCDININYDVIFSDLYNEYVKYLSNKGFRIVNKNEFGKALRLLGYKTKIKTVANFNSNYVEGIKIINGINRINDFSLSSSIRETKSKQVNSVNSVNSVDVKQKTISEKNDEKGKSLLHDSDGILDNLEDL